MLCFLAETARHGIHTATDNVGLHHVHSDLQSHACLKMGCIMATRACVILLYWLDHMHIAHTGGAWHAKGLAAVWPLLGLHQRPSRMHRLGSTACASTHRRAGRLPEKAAPLSAW